MCAWEQHIKFALFFCPTPPPHFFCDFCAEFETTTYILSFFNCLREDKRQQECEPETSNWWQFLLEPHRDARTLDHVSQPTTLREHMYKRKGRLCQQPVRRNEVEHNKRTKNCCRQTTIFARAALRSPRVKVTTVLAPVALHDLLHADKRRRFPTAAAAALVAVRDD